MDLTAMGRGEALSSESRQQLLVHFKETLGEMKERYGKWNVPWGQIHVVGRGGIYFPAPGADYNSGDKEANFSETLLDVRSVPLKELPGVQVANSGSMAMILMFFDSQGVRSFTCTPWGQSGHLDSPHYIDQAAALYSRRLMKPTWWALDEARGNAESTRMFEYRSTAP
jgi:acyl-homoserine lactone acylase PvdQ